MNVLMIGGTYIVLLAVFLFGLLKLFGARFSFTDALLAAVVASALSFIPAVGAALSVIGILLIVYWRASDISIWMVLLTSFLARIAAGLIVYKFLLPHD